MEAVDGEDATLADETDARRCERAIAEERIGGVETAWGKLTCTGRAGRF